jgi:hypothetical protein
VSANRFSIDSDAVLDFAVDWSAWLAAAETIASHSTTASSGITVDSSSESAGVVTIWVSGATGPSDQSITCRITTNQGRTDDRTLYFVVSNR